MTLWPEPAPENPRLGAELQVVEPILTFPETVWMRGDQPVTGRLAGCGLTSWSVGNYSYYMKPRELKVARIGNSRGVRLPAVTLERYQIGESVIMEERADGILLRPIGSAKSRLSWEDTAREMAQSGEDWSDWDGAAADGLDEVPWRSETTHRVAEKRADYKMRRARRKK